MRNDQVVELSISTRSPERARPYHYINRGTTPEPVPEPRRVSAVLGAWLLSVGVVGVVGAIIYAYMGRGARHA